jgi:alcohol dehydrogenase class IV
MITHNSDVDVVVSDTDGGRLGWAGIVVSGTDVNVVVSDGGGSVFHTCKIMDVHLESINLIVPTLTIGTRCLGGNLNYA